MHPQVIAVNMEAVQSVLGMGGQVDSESYTCRSCLARGAQGDAGGHTTDQPAVPCSPWDLHQTQSQVRLYCGLMTMELT